MKLEKYANILFSTLSEITSLTIGGTDRRVIIQRLLEGSMAALEAEKVYLLSLDGDRIVKYSKSRADRFDQAMSVEEVRETPGLRRWMMREGQEGGSPGQGHELAVDLPLLADGCLDAGDANRVIISSPLVTEQSVFGLLVAIHRPDAGGYSPEDERLITALANHAAIAFENRALYQKLEKEAITDGLTGVYNYRFLISSLGTEIKRSQRFRHTFSFVMLDVDNLKEFNDRLGHLSGSEALRAIARIMKQETREIDLVSKYGGDEFAVILPKTDLDGAVVVTRRILRTVEGYAFDGDAKGLLTCSAGVSCFPHDGAGAREIIASADKALYHAKRTGKNAVVTTHDLLNDVEV
jgi:diguanylate cyclase (GGDEF)-like protein